MAEPQGWDWIGTRLQGNQVIVYDRGTTYGEYRLNPFTQLMVKMSGDEYDPDNSPNTWRFIIALDNTIEVPNYFSSVENFPNQETVSSGIFKSTKLPWSISGTAYNTISSAVGDGYNNTYSIVENLDETENTIWTLAEYWREYFDKTWFVPTLEELQILYTNKKYLPNLTRDLFQLNEESEIGNLWSSTESANNAKALNWAIGTPIDLEKTDRNTKFTMCRYL